MSILLHAAGEKIDDTIVAGTGGSIPDYLVFKDLKLCLKHLCREAIRSHLLHVDFYEHLLGRVPKLGLPTSLTEYLLYGVSLDDEDDDDDDCRKLTTVNRVKCVW